MTEPLPCPFCGARPHESNIRDFVQCRSKSYDCPLSGMWIRTHVWNRRAEYVLVDYVMSPFTGEIPKWFQGPFESVCKKCYEKLRQGGYAGYIHRRLAPEAGEPTFCLRCSRCGEKLHEQPKSL